MVGLTHGMTEKEAHDALNKAIDEHKQHDEICIGLMVAILTADPAQAQRVS